MSVCLCKISCKEPGTLKEADRHGKVKIKQESCFSIFLLVLVMRVPPWGGNGDALCPHSRYSGTDLVIVIYVFVASRPDYRNVHH
ncbi:hypothetical protein KIL84_005470 [Mauremys mutica]|uniref:Uncharacterized protein n=1 Tax=Mauremys mutica TaxID=74926 RepID=A0A9D3XJJ6_9SAUR|nr:hypothetical protein KIL84_005470 [Mauremys mutica]